MDIILMTINYKEDPLLWQLKILKTLLYNSEIILGNTK